MSEDIKKYWRSYAEYQPESAAADETKAAHAGISLHGESMPARREFLIAAGFAFAGAALSGCSRAPMEKAIPLLHQPEGITPGRSYYYTGICNGCSAACGLLAGCIDGRPVKLEGNPNHPLSRGGLCAVGQASILGLYDSLRLQQPVARGKPATWRDVDQEISQLLGRIRAEGCAVRVLTQTITSPTLSAQISDFLKNFTDGRHVVCDALSVSPILDAHLHTHGVRVLPRYLFAKADVIVGFDADFLGTWISPVEFTSAYSEARTVEGQRAKFAYHVQFEPRMSLTGTKADRRALLTPPEMSAALGYLAMNLARKAGSSTLPTADAPVPLSATKTLDELAADLWAARGRSLVVCGLSDTNAQVLCNYVNHLLGNYGATLDITAPSYQKQGNDRAFAALMDELAADKVAALFLHGINPVADFPGVENMREALKRIPLVVSLAPRLDESSSLAHFICPECDPLETWTDAEPVAGVAAISQPAIRPLGGSRPALESFARWSGIDASALELVRNFWKVNVYPRQEHTDVFETFWQKSIEAGFIRVHPQTLSFKPFDRQALRPPGDATQAGNEFTLVLYAKTQLPDGRHAYNPWLQELPDPVTKATWDNYACLAPTTAEEMRLKDGDVVRIQTSVAAIEVPVLIQPGQHEKVVAVALGYGRSVSARFSNTGPQWIYRRPTLNPDGMVGVNASSLIRIDNGTIQYWRNDVKLLATGNHRPVAVTQIHHSLIEPKPLFSGAGPRPIVQETTLQELRSGGLPQDNAPSEPETDLWPDDHSFTGHRWAMAVDLNICTGCSACIIACQVENNIPVTGKDEVMRNREMHWIRIDRYYSGPPGDVEVVHQPMMCQHCEHAPCETVCPVLATVHSGEGLNQQVYNRCIGTRYCANNCPYKVRRFNWFKYPREDRLANLTLNPNVTVRSRGVMEKCSFCVQRIQDAKAEAKRENRALRDGEIQTACQQTCPAQAIAFGDLNDNKSRVAQMLNSHRSYRVLEELNVRPSVHYLKVVRNRKTSKMGDHHG